MRILTVEEAILGEVCASFLGGFRFFEYLCRREPIKVWIMTTLQLRAELFREMNPLLDNETAMQKILAFVKSLVPTKKAKTEATEKPYEVMPISPDIKKWSGCASFTDDEIENDPRLKAILSR